MSKSTAWPYIAVGSIALIWGLNFVFIKIALESFTWGSLGLLRYLAMMPILYAICKISYRSIKIEKADWLRAGFAGLLASGIYMVSFLGGMDRVSSGSGAVILATAPLWITFFAILAKQEVFRWPFLIGSLMAYGGVSMVILGGNPEMRGEPLGIFLVAIAAVFWASSVIVMKPLLDKYPAIPTFSFGLPFAGLALIPAGFNDVRTMDFSVISTEGWLAFAYLVFMAGILAFILYYYGVKTIGPAKTGGIGYFVPIIASLGAWVIRGEPMTLIQIGGILVVLAGVAIGRDSKKILKVATKTN